MSESLDTGQAGQAATEFPVAHMRCALREGVVRDWLVARPPVVPLSDPARWAGPDWRGRVVRAVGQADSMVARPPSENGPFVSGSGDTGAGETRWRVVEATEDGLVHIAGKTDRLAYVAVWAYAQVVLPAPLSTTLTFTTVGPLSVWINGEAVLRSVRFYDGRPGQQTVQLPLGAGTSEVLVRLETVAPPETTAAASGDYALVLGLQVADVGREAVVVLPTSLAPVERRAKLAAVMADAYTQADVFHGKQKITLHWPATMNRVDALAVRLQTPAGRIYAEAMPIVQAGSRVTFGAAEQFPSGVYELLLIPQPEEYYVQEMRVERRVPLTIVNDDFSKLYYGTVESRRREALQAAARRTDIWAEVARAALGQMPRIATIEQALHVIRGRGTGMLRTLLALAALDGLQRRRPCLAEPLAQELETVTAVVAEEAGADNGDLIVLVCRVLTLERRDLQSARATAMRDEVAGQLRQIGMEGLRAWQDHDRMADALAALACLIEFGADAALVDLAGATLDRLCLDLALASYQGVVGGPRSASRTAWLKSGRLGPLTGVCRLLWGMGAWSAEQHAQVALAICAGYSVPDVIAAVAVNRDEAALTRLTYAPGSTWAADVVLYRTPDYLLGALVDYHAGTPGEGETLWQAVLGADAVVTVNYPAHSGESDALVPNYWRGDAVRPRVALWQNVVVAIYGGREEGEQVGLDFTHAYLPAAAFDEVQTQAGWVCARKGEGYVALWAAAGVRLMQEGPTAQREVRSPHDRRRGNVWLCRLGRATVDGSFEAFMAALGASLPDVTLGATPTLRWRMPSGHELVFDLLGPLRVDGVAQPSGAGVRMEGPYGRADVDASTLDIRYADTVMRLDFGSGPPAPSSAGDEA